MTSLDHHNLSTLFPTITQVQDDTGAPPTTSGGSHPADSSLVVGRTLQVGDVVGFSCRGVDPRGRDLGWWLHPHGYDPTPRTIGTQVDLQWTVGVRSIGQRVYLGIGMAADAEYHREGGVRELGWDGLVRYLFTVSPQQSIALPVIPNSAGS